MVIGGQLAAYKVRAFGVLFTSIMACVGVQASESEISIFDLSLEELMTIPIKGATLTKESLRSVPSSVTVFNKKHIQGLGVNTLSELANHVLGFQVQRSVDSSGYKTISVRGQRIGDASAEILLVVDGYRFQSPRSGGPEIDGLSLANVERVEFIRGPGAAIYGSNATMGVINVVTSTGARSLAVSGMSNNGVTMDMQASTVVADTVLDLAISHASSKGQIYTVPDVFTREPVLAKDKGEFTKVTLKAQRGDWSGVVINRRVLSAGFYVLGTVAPEVNNQVQDRFLAGLNYASTFTLGGISNIETKTFISYTRDTQTSDSLQAPAGTLLPVSTPPSSAPLFGESILDASEFRIENHNTWDVNDNNTVSLGLEWRNTFDITGIANANYDLEAYVNRDFPIAYSAATPIKTEVLDVDDQSVMALFGQWQHQLLSDTHVTLGLRFDQYQKLSQSNFSPRIGVVHNLNDHHTLKLLYGEAFRAPTVNELGSINNPVVQGSQNLGAETVATWEATWMASYDAISWSLGYFDIGFNNSIAIINHDNDVVRLYDNVEQAGSRGAEFEMAVELNEYWFASSSYSAIFDYDKAVSQSEAKRLATLELNYQNKSWNANVSWVYRGERKTVEEGVESGWRVLAPYNMGLFNMQYFPSENWKVFFRVNNLTNKTVYFPSRSARIPQGIPSRGREFSLGIERKF